jgi:hypothetical protein
MGTVIGPADSIPLIRPTQVRQFAVRGGEAAGGLIDRQQSADDLLVHSFASLYVISGSTVRQNAEERGEDRPGPSFANCSFRFGLCVGDREARADRQCGELIDCVAASAPSSSSSRRSGMRGRHSPATG